GHLAAPAAQPEIADLHFRVRGPLVQQMEQVFLADWSFAAGQPLPGSAARGEHQPDAGDHAGRVITEGPNEDIDRLMMVLIGILATAHERVWIMTPYFLPPAPLLSALQSAALRGIDVSIVIPQRSDQPWLDWATRHILRQLLRRQVRVYLRPAPFAHTKLLLADNWYVQFGSANLDTRSLRLNFELMVESYGAPLAAALARHFAEVRAASHPAQIGELDARRLPARLRDALCWLFSPYL
ncbi:MAG: phospholipase D-like domain-containing protein, partial [Nevskia sp.]|nr:phospholipase D-like domain-containing protein [Nevskia sp.]